MERAETRAELNLVELLFYLKKKIWILIAVILACTAAGAVYTTVFMEPEYRASTRMYILNRSSEDGLTSSDYSVSNNMIKDYAVLITGQNVTKEVVKELGLNMSPGELSGRISVSAVRETRVVQITVVDNDPQRAADIANCVREVASQQIKDILNVKAVNLVYEAEVPAGKSGPDISKNMFSAAGIGLLVTVLVLVLIYVFDDTIRTEEDVEQQLGLFVLGVIPESKEIAMLAEESTAEQNDKENTWQT